MELEVRDLVVRYGDTVAVDGVGLAVRRGEMFGLIGPDGAGKTSLLRACLGLVPAAGGSIRTVGFDPGIERRRLSQRIGYLSQRFSLYGDLTVDENVGFFADLHGVTGYEAIRERLLERVHMSAFRNRLADRLSGGMKQKLALACTLVHTPELLVLDEPTTGVDPVSRREFWRLLFGLRRDGLTIVLTTPYLDEAERCDRVALLDRGRLLALDAPGALRTLPGVTMIEVLARPRARAMEILEGLDGCAGLHAYGEKLHVRFRAVGAARAAEAVCVSNVERALSGAGLVVRTCRAVTPSLEDVFIERIDEADSRGAASDPGGRA